MQNITQIHTEATNSAQQAVSDFLYRWRKQTGGNEYGEPMYCGFAWVDVAVERTNSKEAKALQSIGFRKSYRPKTMTLWDPASTTGRAWTAKSRAHKPTQRYYASMALRLTWAVEQTNTELE